MNSWFLDFDAVFARHFDTPDEFLQGLGFAAAGSALANRVFLRSPDEVTTNLYLLLCSPPGWFHKSTPTRAMVRILKRVIPACEFIPSNASSEALGRLIAVNMNGSGRGHGVMIYDEFRSFLTHIRKEYAANIGTLVVERFERGMDLQFARKSKSEEGDGGVQVDTIPGGFILSFVASTTTPWLLESIRGSDVTGGMLSRFLLIEAHEKTRSSALPVPVQERTMEVLAEGLGRIRESYGVRTEFSFRSDAADDYRTLYKDIERWAMTHGHQEYPALISRAPTYVKKLALLHAAVAMRASPCIIPEDVEAAAEIVVRSIRSCESIVDEILSNDSVYAKGLMRVKRVIESKKRISKRDLLRSMHVRVKDLDEMLDSLHQQGVIRYERDGKHEVVAWIG